MINKIYYSTGKKKTSIARIFIKENNFFEITINNLNIDKYCNNNIVKNIILKPFNIINYFKYKIYITVKGGGISSQSYAIRYGIIKSILNINNEYKKLFRINNFITRDSRIVERKKVGFKKSRKKPQFSKR